MNRKYRKVPSEQAGYGPGQWVVQYYDPAISRWFDVGDPLTEEGANERLKQKRCQHRATGDTDFEGRAYVHCYECGRLLDDMGPEGTMHEDADPQPVPDSVQDRWLKRREEDGDAGL